MSGSFEDERFAGQRPQFRRHLPPHARWSQGSTQPKIRRLPIGPLTAASARTSHSRCAKPFGSNAPH